MIILKKLSWLDKTNMTNHTNADWMKKMSATIGPLKLNQIVLPGTHDSGSYSIADTADYSPDAPNFVKKIEQISTWLANLIKPIVAGWARSQCDDFKQQLESGVRYLDLRTSLHTSSNVMRVVHAMYGCKIDVVLTSIKEFLALYPNEIIILDFNHFYNMTTSSHQTLCKKIIATFGNLMINQTQTPGITLNELWKGTGRVIVLYDNAISVKDNPQLWSENSIQSPWPSTANLTVLKSKLGKELPNERKDQFFVLQGILTPDATTIIKGLIPFSKNPSTLKALAQQVDPAFMKWIKNDWSQDNLNIIICDWVQFSDLVKVVLSLNLSTSKE